MRWIWYMLIYILTGFDGCRYTDHLRSSERVRWHGLVRCKQNLRWCSTIQIPPHLNHLNHLNLIPSLVPNGWHKPWKFVLSNLRPVVVVVDPRDQKQISLHLRLPHCVRSFLIVRLSKNEHLRHRQPRLLIIQVTQAQIKKKMKRSKLYIFPIASFRLQ